MAKLEDNGAKDKKSVGKQGEDIACLFLERKGFSIIDRNYRKPWGEIDIIAEKDRTVRFIEVKALSREMTHAISREINEYMPEEQVTRRKLGKLARTAVLYMEKMKDTREFQIDVVSVLLDRKQRVAHCKLIEQALEDNL